MAQLAFAVVVGVLKLLQIGSAFALVASLYFVGKGLGRASRRLETLVLLFLVWDKSNEIKLHEKYEAEAALNNPLKMGVNNAFKYYLYTARQKQLVFLKKKYKTSKSINRNNRLGRSFWVYVITPIIWIALPLAFIVSFGNAVAHSPNAEDMEATAKAVALLDSIPSVSFDQIKSLQTVPLEELISKFDAIKTAVVAIIGFFGIKYSGKVYIKFAKGFLSDCRGLLKRLSNISITTLAYFFAIFVSSLGAWVDVFLASYLAFRKDVVG